MSWVKALTKIVTFALPFSNGIETVRTCIVFYAITLVSCLISTRLFSWKCAKKLFSNSYWKYCAKCFCFTHYQIYFPWNNKSDSNQVFARCYTCNLILRIMQKQVLVVSHLDPDCVYLHGSLECKVSITY